MLKERSEFVLPVIVFGMFIVLGINDRFGDVHEAVLPPPGAVVQVLRNTANCSLQDWPHCSLRALALP